MESLLGLLKHLTAIATIAFGLTPSPAVSPTPIPSFQPSYVNNNLFFTTLGKYEFMGQGVSYSVSFPTTGGPIKGGFTGICQGTITGDYAGNEGGVIEGTANGECGVLMLKQEVKGAFKGNVYPNEKRIDITYEGSMAGTKNSGKQSLKIE